MPTPTVSNISTKIISFFKNKVPSLAKAVGFSQRNSKLTGSAFVEALLGSCLMGDTRYEAQCSLLKQKKIAITKQGLSYRMNAKSLQLLSFLLDEALSEFKSQQCEVLELFKSFSGVKIQDSTGIELPSKLSALFKGHGGSASSASLKLQVLYDDINCSIDQLFVTDGNRNDQGFTRHLDTIQPEALYLQDLGYFSLRSLKKIKEGNAYFLSRYLPQTMLYHPDDENTPIDLLALLRTLPDTYYETNVLLGKNQYLPVRLVAQRLDEQQKSKRLKHIIRSCNRKRKPSKLILELAGWSIYITNVPGSILSTQAIHHVYALRWQVELFFKLTKSYANIDEMRGKTPFRVLCELYAKLIVVILFLFIASPSRWLDNARELSLPKAYLIFKAFAFPFLQALTSSYRLKKCLSTLAQQFLACAQKDKASLKKISSYQKIQSLSYRETSF